MFFGTEVQHGIRIPAEMKAESRGLGMLWGEAEECFKGRSCCLRDFIFAMFDTSQGVSPCCSEQWHEGHRELCWRLPGSSPAVWYFALQECWTVRSNAGQPGATQLQFEANLHFHTRGGWVNSFSILKSLKIHCDSLTVYPHSSGLFSLRTSGSICSSLQGVHLHACQFWFYCA